MANAYICWRINGASYILRTDLTRSDGHFDVTSTNLKESETSETSEHHEYCHGCESGADCPGAHSEECNKVRGITSTFPIT
jgi:hypothetical protein